MNPSNRRTALIRLFLVSIAAHLSTQSAIPVAAAPAGGPNGPAISRRSTGTLSGRVQNAITGQYLYQARVVVRGTNLVAFTDETGTYVLSNVPGGPVVLEVFYTGLDPQQVAIDFPGGTGIGHDVALTNTARHGKSTEAIRLDPFLVSSSKNEDVESLDTNLQRFAPNIKNTVAMNSFGDVTEGNVAEFLKFMPGVTVEYIDVTPTSISVRGLSSNTTGVTVDGDPMANTQINNNRFFVFNNSATNNLSRIEVTKVPTPANAADSMGGSINMVSKSAFEKGRAEFNYRLFVSANSTDLNLKRTPYASDNKTHKVLPGLELDYTLPLTKTFGIVFSGSVSNQYNPQDGANWNYNGAGTATGASFSRPFLNTFLLIDAPKTLARYSGSVKADWRVTPHSVLSISGQGSFYRDTNRSYNTTFNTGTNGTPTVATGTPMSFGDDFTIGATGRGAITQGGSSHNMASAVFAGAVRYRLDNGAWRINTGGSVSKSRLWSRPLNFDHFGPSLAVSNRIPIRVTLTTHKKGIDRGDRLISAQAFDNNNREVDIYDINNYQLTGGTVQEYDVIDLVKSADLNVRRSLGFLPFPSGLQIGGAHRSQARDRNRFNKTYSYAGVNGSLSPAPYVMQVYRSGPRYGLGEIPWVSHNRAKAAWDANPNLFFRTTANIVSDESGRINLSEYIKESISSGYAQADVRLFQNRLYALGGVRYERTVDDGLGRLNDPNAVWMRNPDGSFAHNAAGQQIRKPEAGAVGSLEQLYLTQQERAYHAKRSYDDYFPSLHLTYSILENLLARAAYARTLGRPSFTQIIPNTTVNERDNINSADPSAIPGTISIRNTGLKPWTSDNFDLSLEYYSKQGGMFSVGAFRKNIENFFGAIVKIATAADIEQLGLEPQYAGWQLSTTVNAGNARVSGLEFNARHSLRPLGGWGSYFTAFVNATKLKLEGGAVADFSGFTPETVNWGITFIKKPISIMARWNYRGTSRTSAIVALGPDAFNYTMKATTLDLNFDLQFSKKLSLFANARNVLNALTRTNLTYGSMTPDYARVSLNKTYGVQFALGIKGTY